MPRLVRLAQIVENTSVSDASNKHLKVSEIFINSDNVIFIEEDSAYKRRVSQSPHWPNDLDSRINITKIHFNTMSNSKYEHVHVLGDALNIAEKLGGYNG